LGSSRCSTIQLDKRTQTSLRNAQSESNNVNPNSGDTCRSAGVPPYRMTSNNLSQAAVINLGASAHVNTSNVECLIELAITRADLIQSIFRISGIADF